MNIRTIDNGYVLHYRDTLGHTRERYCPAQDELLAAVKEVLQQRPAPKEDDS